MMNRLLYRLTAGLPARLIKLDGKPYLERYFVGQVFGVTVYLHRFVSSDSERHLHNHPWGWGRALVLAGCYDEDSVTDLSTAAPDGCVTRTRRVWLWNRVDGAYFHRVSWVKPGTWTLFMHGPRVYLEDQAAVPKGWGFLRLEGDLVVFEQHPPPVAARDRFWWKYAPHGRDVGRVRLKRR